MLSYRHHITALLQALLILFAFASCIGDEIADGMTDAETLFDEDRPCYLTIRIKSVDNSSFTRADAYTGKEGKEDEDGQNANSGDFVHGDEGEHGIGKDGNFIIFFDDDDKLFAITKLEMADGHTDNPGHNPTTEPDDYIETLYKTKIFRKKVLDKVKNTLPKSCLVVLNGEQFYDELTQKTKIGQTDQSEILKWLWTDAPQNIGYGNNGRFTMTNSVYADGNKLCAAVEIKKEHFGLAEEQKADEDPTIDKKELHVHVERMLAKYTFSSEKTIFQPSTEADLVMFTGFDQEDAPQYAAKKWRVEITGWGINALESNSHLFKNINSDGGYFNSWNENTLFRSYWSEDPDYTKYNYPWQYRQAIDIDNIKNYENDGSILTNYSFNALNLNGSKKSNNYSWNAPIYTPEHTYNANADEIKGKLDDREELLAGTHLLIGAELQLEKDNEKDQYETKNWYRDRNGLYYPSEQYCFAALMHAFNQTLISQEILEFTLYNWEEFAKPDADSFVAKSSGEYRLYYKGRVLDDDYLKEIMNMTDQQFAANIGSMAPAMLRRGDGKCLPWIENSIENGNLTIKKADGTLLQIYYKDKDPLGTTLGNFVRNANSNDIKSLLYEWVGAVDHFNQGKMYYAHGIYNPTNNTDKTKNWGVIRNNWYRLNLTDIASMGIPVDDPDQPIVPDRVGNEDKINVSVYLLDWHEVETTIDSDYIKK